MAHVGILATLKNRAQIGLIVEIFLRRTDLFSLNFWHSFDEEPFRDVLLNWWYAALHLQYVINCFLIVFLVNPFCTLINCWVLMDGHCHSTFDYLLETAADWSMFVDKDKGLHLNGLWFDLFVRICAKYSCNLPSLVSSSTSAIAVLHCCVYAHLLQWMNGWNERESQK